MALWGLAVGGAVRFAKFAVEQIKDYNDKKYEDKQRLELQKFELEKITTLKEKDIDIENYRHLTASAEAEKVKAEVEIKWIEAVAKMQSQKFDLLPYFSINENKSWFDFWRFDFFKGIGNALILITNLIITGANIFKGSQREFITLLIGYAILFVIGKDEVSTKTVMECMIFTFEAIVSYNFLDKKAFQKKNS